MVFIYIYSLEYTLICSPLTTPQDDVCFLQLDPLHERTDDPPAIACPIAALITIYETLYHISHALRTFLADTPEQHLTRAERYPRT